MQPIRRCINGRWYLAVTLLHCVSHYSKAFITVCLYPVMNTTLSSAMMRVNVHSTQQAFAITRPYDMLTVPSECRV